MNNNNEEENPFAPHKVAESINKDLNNVLTGQVMTNFKNGLNFKSARTRQTDEALVGLLVGRLKMYADGWVKANSLKTAELWQKAQAYDAAVEGLRTACKSINALLNESIIYMKQRNQIDEETLQELRQLELKLQNLFNHE